MIPTCCAGRRLLHDWSARDKCLENVHTCSMDVRRSWLQEGISLGEISCRHQQPPKEQCKASFVLAGDHRKWRYRCDMGLLAASKDLQSPNDEVCRPGEGCYYFLEQLTWLIKAGRYFHLIKQAALHHFCSLHSIPAEAVAEDLGTFSI